MNRYFSSALLSASLLTPVSYTHLNPDGSTFTVHFAHRQRWSPPTRCANAYFSGQSCIAQREEWWDDNGSPFALRIDRTQQLARGLGVGFTIRQTFPITWGADGRYFWRW